jgi:hypothetical protein
VNKVESVSTAFSSAEEENDKMYSALFSSILFNVFNWNEKLEKVIHFWGCTGLNWSVLCAIFVLWYGCDSISLKSWCWTLYRHGNCKFIFFLLLATWFLFYIAVKNLIDFAKRWNRNKSQRLIKSSRVMKANMKVSSYQPRIAFHDDFNKKTLLEWFE